MLEWLVPVCLFFVVTSIYLGGTSVDLEGGSGLRQVAGLVGTLVLFLVVWGVLHTVLGRFAGLLGQVIIPSLVTVLLLPVISRAAFRLVGVRVRKVGAGGH
jgi:hypothetical protein